MITVLLVDDHAMVRDGLARLLAADGDIDVVAQTADGAAAAELAARLRPAVALVDLAMPGLDGIATTRLLRAASARTHVVVLTAFSDRRQILAALDAGAVGYLLKDAGPAELIDGVRAAARGESPLHPKAARELLTERDSPGGGTLSEEPDLTARESEILALLAKGMPNKRIALDLGISEKTVKAHVTSIFQRLGVSDRTQAALWAHRHGLV